MNDQIVLHQDEDGNYTVDVVGLMYLLKTKSSAGRQHCQYHL